MTSANTTVFYEDGAQVYPCRCGETHRGPYAVYDYGHHNCFHDVALMALDGGLLICPSCGKDFDAGNA